MVSYFMSAPAIRPVKPPSKAPLSLIALQIVRESLAPDASLPELAKLAASDPGFALRIIAVVNSPRKTAAVEAASNSNAAGVKRLPALPSSRTANSLKASTTG